MTAPRFLPLALLALFAPAAAHAATPDPDAHLYLAADPLPYALHGFSAHIGVQLPGDNFSLEAAVFSSRLGSTLLKLVEPGDDGFTANLRGVTLEGYWHAVRWEQSALLLGAQLHLDRFEVSYPGEPGQPSFNQIYLLRRWPFAGFRSLEWGFSSSHLSRQVQRCSAPRRCRSGRTAFSSSPTSRWRR